MKNIKLGFDKKKKFTIDGDENKVIELDTSDVGVITRLEKSVDTIKQFEVDTEETDGEKILSELSDKEQKMRDLIDYIFDSPVSDTILGESSCFSLRNGNYKFETIITVLLELYGEDIQKETKKFDISHVEKHTGKYTK